MVSTASVLKKSDSLYGQVREKLDVHALRIRYSVPAGEKKSRPWDNLEAGARWSRWRKVCYEVLHHKVVEILMVAVISFNVVLMIVEADMEAECFPEYQNDLNLCPKLMRNRWVHTVNLILLCVYTAEAMISIAVDRKLYFTDLRNMFDLGIVASGWISEASGSGSLQFLRIFRVTRLSRAFRMLLEIRELYLLVNGIVSSCRAIFFGTLMLFFMFVTYAIVLVQFVHPVNVRLPYGGCVECQGIYSSVWRATLTLFREVIAGGSFIISFELAQASPVAVTVLCIMVITIALGAVNMILTVIVERAAEAREQNIRDRANDVLKEQAQCKRELLEECVRLDVNDSGALTYPEMVSAYREPGPFRNTMNLMHVQEDDLPYIFKILDGDHSGDIDYKEFCDGIFELRSTDQRLNMAAIRLQLQELKLAIKTHLLRKMDEVAKKLEDKTNHLISIDTKLEQLVRGLVERDSDPCNESVPLSRKPQIIVEARKELDQPLRDAIPPCSPSIVDLTLEKMPVAPKCPDLDLTIRENSAREDLEHLVTDIQRIADTKIKAARCMDDQVAVLCCHAKLLTWMSEMLPKDVTIQENSTCRTTASSVEATAGVRVGSSQAMCEKIRFLKQSIDDQFVKPSGMLDSMVSNALNALAANEKLLTSMAEEIRSSFGKDEAKTHARVMFV